MNWWVLDYLRCGHLGHIYQILAYTEYPWSIDSILNILDLISGLECHSGRGVGPHFGDWLTLALVSSSPLVLLGDGWCSIDRVHRPILLKTGPDLHHPLVVFLQSNPYGQPLPSEVRMMREVWHASGTDLKRADMPGSQVKNQAPPTYPFGRLRHVPLQHP